MTVLDPAGMTLDELRRLLLGVVVPRPIAWTSTISVAGVRNLAPFSFFTVVSNQPPMVVLTLERRADGGLKDTLVNVRDTGEFVINIASVELLDALAGSSREHPPDADEFDIYQVPTCDSDLVRAPRIPVAPVNLECRLVDIQQPGSDSVIFGEVVRAHLQPAAVDATGQPLPAGIRPIARVGDGFAELGDTLWPARIGVPAG